MWLRQVFGGLVPGWLSCLGQLWSLWVAEDFWRTSITEWASGSPCLVATVEDVISPLPVPVAMPAACCRPSLPGWTPALWDRRLKQTLGHASIPTTKGSDSRITVQNSIQSLAGFSSCRVFSWCWAWREEGLRNPRRAVPGKCGAEGNL